MDGEITKHIPTTSMSTGKQRRSPDFKDHEVKALLSYIDKYKKYIMNKASNAATNHRKELAWKKVAMLYNNSGFEFERSVGCLKHKWENLKNNARKLNILDDNFNENNDIVSKVAAMLCEFEKNSDSIEYQSEDIEELQDHVSGDDSDTCTSRTTKFRSPKFSEEETMAFVKILEKYKNVVFDKCTQAHSMTAKENAWKEITKALNKKGFPHERNVNTLKKKLDNLRRDAKKVSKDVLYETDANDAALRVINMICEVKDSADTNDTLEDDGKEDKQIDEGNSMWSEVNEQQYANESEDGSEYASYHKKRILNRATNFSPLECKLLLQCVRENKDMLFMPGNTNQIIGLKNSAWKKVTDTFNERNCVRRSPKMLRTKFRNLRHMSLRLRSRTFMGGLRTEVELAHRPPREIKLEPAFKADVDVDVESEAEAEAGGVHDHDMDETTMEGDDAFEPPEGGARDAGCADPLRVVLNGDHAAEFSNNNMDSSQTTQDVVKLQTELLNYQLETAKLERRRVEAALSAEAQERERRALETSLRLRAARLAAAAAERALPPGHAALRYAPDEQRAQIYLQEFLA